MDRRQKPLMSHPRKLRSISRVGGFWREVLDRNRVSSLPDALEKLSRQGRLNNFRIAAGEKLKRPMQVGPWDDSDVYKWVEAASMALIVDPSDALRRSLDEVVTLIVNAQEPDGYIDTRQNVLQRPRWDKEHTENHVLYNMGHLIEAGIAHRVATGNDRLFDVGRRAADCIGREFGPGKRAWAPQHQEIELALVKLFEETGERRYLDLALFFLDQRGHAENRKSLGIYQQDHLPVRDQAEIVGHSVRALYQNIAMHDVALYTGDEGLYAAQGRMWDDMAGRKLLISGGAGRVHEGPNGLEGFRDPFDLDSSEPDVDTCTSIAILLWAQRRLAHTDEAGYADFVEHTMYNRILAGISLSGTNYFYGMPLEAVSRDTFDSCGQAGPVMGVSEHYRQPWYRVPCCPSNIQRVIALFPALAIRSSDDTLTIDQYLDIRETMEVGDASIAIDMRSGYPFDGNVRVALQLSSPASFTLRLRRPSWLDGKVMDGRLYSSGAPKTTMTVTINGASVECGTNGYVSISRTWSDGDRIEIELPLEARLATAVPQATALNGQAALLVGPLVYCAEVPADKFAHVRPGAALQQKPTQHACLPVLSFKLAEGEEMLPLFAWDNRGPTSMRVWFDTSQKPS